MSVKRRMMSGAAVAIMLILGFMVVGTFWVFISNFVGETPDPTLGFMNLVILVVEIFILGWFITSRWYQSKVRM